MIEFVPGRDGLCKDLAAIADLVRRLTVAFLSGVLPLRQSL
jgi:hypothetical protein